MTLTEAFETIERWSKEGQEVGDCRHRYGYVIIDRGGMMLGLTSCPVCGATTGMGVITVSHDDGRGVGIEVPFYHYVEAGHPISKEQLDTDLLFAIIADFETPPAGLESNEMTVAQALELVREIGLNGEKAGPYVRRSGRIMVHPGVPRDRKQYCIHCGVELGREQVSVMHEDGRDVSFDVAMYHYAEAGHPITAQQLDSRRLLAMLADR